MLFLKICKYLANPKNYDKPNIYLCSSQANNRLLYKNNKLQINNDLRLDVVQKMYDQLTVGYAGVKKIMLLIQQYYFWPKIKKDINQYIKKLKLYKTNIIER